MKRIHVLLLVLASFSAPAFAGDSSSGCGLGWMLLPKNSLVSSFFRFMTNATFSSTIGMTIGTSGCAKHSIVFNNKRGLHFAEANQDLLAVDMAAGHGEYLAAFADTMGCGWNAYGDFSTAMQQNFASIYPTSTTSAPELVSNVQNEIMRHPVLSRSCTVAM